MASHADPASRLIRAAELRGFECPSTASASLLHAARSQGCHALLAWLADAAEKRLCSQTECRLAQLSDGVAKDKALRAKSTELSAVQQAVQQERAAVLLLQPEESTHQLQV